MFTLEGPSGKALLYPIDSEEGNHEWYALLGFLKYRGYRLQELNRSLQPFQGYAGPVAILAGKSDRRLQRLGELLWLFPRASEILVTGREVVYQPDRFEETLGLRGRAIPGDPQYPVAGLVDVFPAHHRSPGAVWHPAEYRNTYAGASWTGDTAYVRYGNGCLRSCGYCPYGYHYKMRYGDNRAYIRPVPEMEAEIVDWARGGKKNFRLVAEQVLIDPPEANRPFEDVCKIVGSAVPDGALLFTTTPADIVRNADLLERCGRHVHIIAFLCFDFVDDLLQEQFELRSRSRDHIAAVDFLLAHNMKFVPHFIFLNPLMTSDSLDRILDWMEKVASQVMQSDPLAALRLVRGLFCSSFHEDEVTPASPQLRETLFSSVPEAGALATAAVMISLFRTPETRTRFMNSALHHSGWPTVLADACRDLARRVTKEEILDEAAIDKHIHAILDAMEEALE